MDMQNFRTLPTSVTTFAIVLEYRLALGFPGVGLQIRLVEFGNHKKEGGVAPALSIISDLPFFLGAGAAACCCDCWCLGWGLFTVEVVSLLLFVRNLT